MDPRAEERAMKMALPVGEDLSEGFCSGIYEVTVDVGPRIRLPRDIIKTLLNHQIETLWVYPDPTGPRLIVIPDSNRQAYMRIARENLPASLPSDRACREFLCAGRQIPVRNHGRISVASFHAEGFSSGVADTVVIIGTGLWYELWRQDDWFTNTLEIGKQRRHK